MSENSYLRDFRAQVSQIVFLTDLTFFRLLLRYEQKCEKNHISTSSVHKYHKTCSKLIWPFYGLIQLYERKSRQIHISTSCVHKYPKSCSYLIWPFYGLLLLYEQKF